MMFHKTYKLSLATYSTAFCRPGASTNCVLCVKVPLRYPPWSGLIGRYGRWRRRRRRSLIAENIKNE